MSTNPRPIDEEEYEPVSRGKKFLFSLMVLGILVLSAEALVSAWALLMTGSLSRAREIAERREVVEALTDWKPKGGGAREGSAWERRLSPHPFLGYTYNPQLEAANAQGFNSPYVFEFAASGLRIKDQPGKGRALVVGVFGGSFAEQSCAFGDFRRLEAKLAKNREEPVIVLNFALGGHALPQTLHAFLEYRELLDVAVFLDGINEIANPLHNAEAGAPVLWAKAWTYRFLTNQSLSASQVENSAQALATRRDLLQGTELSLWPVLRSSLILHKLWRRYSVHKTAKIVAFNKAIRDEAKAEGPAPAKISQQELLDFAVRNWRRQHRLIHRICQDEGIVDLHLLQPALCFEASKTSLTSVEEQIIAAEKRGSFWGPLNATYPRLKEELKELRKEKVRAVDMTELFKDRRETCYSDPVHCSKFGYTLVVDALSARIEEAIAGR